MRTASRLAGALAVLLAAAPALATNGMRMTGFGPVQNSMGGVGVGATLDANSVVTNPAGLPELGGRLDVGATWFKPTVDYKASESPLPPPFTGAVVAQPDTKISSDRGGSIIPALAASFPITPDLAFGLGINGVAGMGVDYKSNLYGGKTYSSYMQARFAPGLGWRLGMISVGATLNLMMAQMKWDVAGGLGQTPHDSATSYGYGATIGIKIKPSEDFSIGLAYETQSLFRQFSFTVPPHTAINPATFSPVQVPGGEDRLRFDQPSVLTGGVAFNATAALLVAADVEYIFWADTNGRDMPAFANANSGTGTMPWNLNWGNQFVFKVGAQYQFQRGLAVRLGYNYGKMPLDPSRALENIAFPAIAEHHVSAGASYDINKAFTVALGLTYAPQATLKGNNALYPAQGGQAIASYTTNMSQIAIDAGLTYKF